jgi:alanine-glyoxylate transaminase/serine-glyoxylate transaminase/serine-pyruvate transaminase
MSVRAGREFLAIPGPTTMPDEVLLAMRRPAVDIYSGPLLALTDGLMRDVARVFKTKTAPASIAPMATAPGRPLSSMFSRGGQDPGAGERQVRRKLGRACPPHGCRGGGAEGRYATRCLPGRGRGAPKSRQGSSIKAVLVAQIDTASGVVNDWLGKQVKA